MINVYFAGPHVFLPNAKQWADNVKEMCEGTCINPIIPSDNAHLSEPYDTLPTRIYQENIDLMDMCDGIIADITPFRGVSCDSGTAFEIGYMTAQKKPVFLYSQFCWQSYKERVDVYNESLKKIFPEFVDNLAIEDFDLTENLMITRLGARADVEKAIFAADTYWRNY